MLFSSLLRNWNRSTPAARRRTQTSRRQRAGLDPRLEALEARCLFSTWVVSSLSDSGAGSLRAEIAAAQSGDTIVFSTTLLSATTLSSSTTKSGSTKNGHGKPTPPPPPPPPTPTITLTSGELDLTKDLTIQGPGAGQLIVTGSASSRAFEVAPTATVTLSGLTISGESSAWTSYPDAAPWDGYGGGILNHGTLTINACTVSGVIYGNDTEGGGIFNDGTLFLNDSTVSQCEAQGDATSGAAIANWGTATLTNTVISNNSADPGTLSYPWFNKGGGICNSGIMTLNGCTVTGNVARTAGGGIFNDGTLILNGTKVFNNLSYYGGGVYNAGTMTIENYTSINEVDNVGVLINWDNTNTIGTLDSNPAWLYPVYQ